MSWLILQNTTFVIFAKCLFSVESLNTYRLTYVIVEHILPTVMQALTLNLACYIQHPDLYLGLPFEMYLNTYLNTLIQDMDN